MISELLLAGIRVYSRDYDNLWGRGRGRGSGGGYTFSAGGGSYNSAWGCGTGYANDAHSCRVVSDRPAKGVLIWSLI